MKISVEVFTIKVDDVVVYGESIQDMYTTVQPRIQKSWNLNKEALDLLSKDTYARNYEHCFHLGEFETKDVLGTYGNVKLSIERVLIDLN